MPLVVLAPLVALTPAADHRFNVYGNGGMFRDDPWRIVSRTVASSAALPDLGNFRPLGRMLEKSLDLLAFCSPGSRPAGNIGCGPCRSPRRSC